MMSHRLARKAGPFRVLTLAILACAWTTLGASFSFPNDTFAYANELVWEYQLDPTSGKMISRRHEPKPNYALHCFPMVRSVRQFLFHARFEPNEPKAGRASYRQLIRIVLGRSARQPTPPAERLVIPGYANLREFSREQEALLKEASGGMWQSYLQRGNWRMVFPFSGRHQRATADQLIASLDAGRPPIVHLVCFPSQTINHGLLLIDYHRSAEALSFTAYDPNNPDAPTTLSFRRDAGFQFPANHYFAGGPVKVYEIYHGLCY